MTKETPSEPAPQRGPSRRGFLRGTAASAGGLAAAFRAGEAEAQAAPTVADTPLSRVPVHLMLNGEAVEAEVEPALDLLAFLRERQGLTGTKVGCNHGQCGACTVHMDGERVLACLVLAAKVDGREVTTIEGLADHAAREGTATEDGLHPLQAAFMEHDALQCGYCTPGQIMSGAAMMASEGGIPADDARMRDLMSGNLCRCAAYPGIQAAMRAVRDGTNDPTDGGRRGPLEPVAAPETAG